ncbi:dTDP-4-dehydrorhamnose 3,5-epimerase [Sphaerochaeta sp.]|uniref:dTDP-4-dehydrorhamnose 3,5-epimerase n=1 Tax=Sphaerochaeta sp. TaxID=1972642 RepID=UPI003D0F2086
MPFRFSKLPLDGLVLIEPQVFTDDRGFVMESFKASDFASNELPSGFVQENHSVSSKNVLRGLHYQTLPYAQGKLIRCVRGKVADIAVDIRRNSPTFGQWVKEVLSAENRKMLYIPSGFAHGFVVLSETAEVIYKIHGSEYAPQYERGIRWDDPVLAIEWGVKDVIVSDKDMKQPLFKDAEVFE